MQLHFIVLGLLIVAPALLPAAQGGKSTTPIELALTVSANVAFFNSENDQAVLREGIVKAIQKDTQFRVLTADDPTPPARRLVIVIVDARTVGKSGTRWQAGFVGMGLTADAEVTDAKGERVLAKRRIEGLSSAQSRNQVEQLYPNLVKHFAQQVTKFVKDVK